MFLYLRQKISIIRSWSTSANLPGKEVTEISIKLWKLARYYKLFIIFITFYKIKFNAVTNITSVSDVSMLNPGMLELCRIRNRSLSSVWCIFFLLFFCFIVSYCMNSRKQFLNTVFLLLESLTRHLVQEVCGGRCTNHMS